MRFLVFFLSMIISCNSFAQDAGDVSSELGFFDEPAITTDGKNPLKTKAKQGVFDQVPEGVAKEGIQSFAKPSAVSKTSFEEPIMPELNVAIGGVALNNIINAESAFCYSIEKKPEDYKGYTLDGFAITGFCGIINENLQKRIVNEFFRTPSNIVLDKVEECSISPKVIIRFVRGVDYTDILISSPCYSYAVFYANKLKAFNAKPMQAFLRSLIEAFEKADVPFISPTLHNQLIPQGKDTTKKEIKKKPTVIREVPRASGWNKLSF